jgi:hypothetical protein
MDATARPEATCSGHVHLVGAVGLILLDAIEVDGLSALVLVVGEPGRVPCLVTVALVRGESRLFESILRGDLSGQRFLIP